MRPRSLDNRHYRRAQRKSQPRRAGPISPPPLDALADALVVILDELVAHRDRRGPLPLQSFTLEELQAHSAEEWMARDIVADPMEFCLRKGLKAAAKLVAPQVTNAMLGTLVYCWSNYDPENFGQRHAALDSAFNETVTIDGSIWLK